MAILKKEVLYAKEIDDILVLLVHIVKEAKAGKDAGEIASGAVSKLIDAIGGIDQVALELKANRAACIETVGYRVGELTDAILSEKAIPVAEVAVP